MIMLKKKGTIYINLVQKSYFKLAKCVIVPIIELIQKNLHAGKAQFPDTKFNSLKAFKYMHSSVHVYVFKLFQPFHLP